MRICCFILPFLFFILSTPLFAVVGEEIAKKAYEIPVAATARTDIVMHIHRGNDVSTKEYNIIFKKISEKESKALISFVTLADIRVKLLTHIIKGKETVQWMRMSRGKIKRIASAERGKSLANSHFSYADMKSRDLNDYVFQYMGKTTAANFNCHKIRAVRKKGREYDDDDYDWIVIYCRELDNFIVRVDFFKDGKFYKYLENYFITWIPIKGSNKRVPTPFKTVMYMADGSGQTVLEVKNVKYGIKINDSVFNKENLK